jgi:Protein of unknown function (DUF1573).
LTVPFKLYNIGTEPLVIYEAQTSCGCAEASYPKRLLQPKREGVITIDYDSHKNTGYSEIYVTVVANTDSVMFHTLKFDVNVGIL